MRLRRWSPFGSGVLRLRSSPPSPEFEWPPRRFIATASVSCASFESAPRLIAPVEKRLTISLAGSTSSIGIGSDSRAQAEQAAQQRELRVLDVDALGELRVGLRPGGLVADRALQRARSSAGSHMWRSPSRRQR